MTMKPIRSFLFVPGNRSTWIAKIPGFGADAVILDLEDSVPVSHKTEARKIVSEAIPGLSAQGQRVFVRINKGPYLYDWDDLNGVIQPGLEGLVLPKPNGPEDIDILTQMVCDVEWRKGMEVGAVSFIPTLETARSVQFAYDIARRERVATLAGVSAKNGDVARSIGFQWTAQGMETLYLKSQAVLACRAAGKLYPIGGLWQDVHDLDGLRASLKFHRQLGFCGEMLLHPSNVGPCNEAYTPGPEETAYYEGMIKAFEEAQAQGRAAVLYEGEHIDYAHVKTARQVLELVRNFQS